MKNFISSFLLCFALLEVHGQVNLVPNPSFEDYTDCPQGYPDLEGKLNDWMSFSGTPDYMNNCNPLVGTNNQFGFQEPNTGKAYTGFLSYQPTLPNSREHLGVQLNGQLQIGTKYYVSFFVSQSYTPLQCNIATNMIGALFTMNPYFEPAGQIPLQNTCQIVADNIISDTINWTKISGSFIADSAYRYLVIGNFFEDQFLDTLHLPYSVVPQVSYYYLDDVCVSTDSLYAENWTTLNVSNLSLDVITVYPNPVSDNLYINSQNKIENIEIYDFFGHLIYSQQNFPNEEYVLNIEKINSGIYFFKIRTEFAETIKKIVIN
jgi:hypothetical protein